MSASNRALRACTSCRLLKIKCSRDGDSPQVVCENCQKSGRDCIFQPLVRTRYRKRTDARVTELEQRIRALTSMVNARTDTHNNDAFEPLQHDVPAAAIPATSTGEIITARQSDSPLSAEAVNSDTLDGSQPRPSNSVHTDVSYMSPSGRQDIIDQGLLTWTTALHLFQQYQAQLVPRYPIVPVVDTMDPAKLRRDKPVLFLAMITAAATLVPGELRDALHETTLQTYAALVLVEGTKSLEILQAILITIAWYRPCGSFHDTKYLQYTQVASLMAQELRLDHSKTIYGIHNLERAATNHKMADHDRGRMRSMEASMEIEEDAGRQRTLIASYLQSSTKFLLSNSPGVPFDPKSVAACVQSFETSLAISECDKDLVALVKMQFLTQEALQTLNARNAHTAPRIGDKHAETTIRIYEKQIMDILKSAGDGQAKAFLDMTFHASILHLNEMVFYEDYDVEDFRPPYSLERGRRAGRISVDSASVTAISKCRNSSQQLLSILHSQDLSLLASAPSVVFVRMMYALLVLYKIFLLVISTDHPLKGVLESKELHLPNYLMKMHEILSHLKSHQSFYGANKYINFVNSLQQGYERYERTSILESLPPSIDIDARGASNLQYVGEQRGPYDQARNPATLDMASWWIDDPFFDSFPDLQATEAKTLEAPSQDDLTLFPQGFEHMG